MKSKFIDYYTQVAELISTLSTAQKLQVGCVIVKDDRILSQGYNGTPRGWSNQCEENHYCLSRDFNGDYFPGTEVEYPYLDQHGRRYKLVTKPEVMHAERNALDKLARSDGGGMGAVMFITHAPCIECAKSIYATGISHVYYRNTYRTNDGVQFLEKCGVGITQVV